MLYSWDNFDRLRKVPKNVDGFGLENHIGKPVSMIPDPYGNQVSYGRHFEQEFEDAIKQIAFNEVPMKFVYQSKEYQSGRYNPQIIHSLKNRHKIYDIIMSFKTQDSDEGERETYYPINVYCKKCGKDFTRVIGFDEKTDVLTYQCKCDQSTHKVDMKTADNVKLVWKVDWPMRWAAEGVSFEAAGPDHHSDGGSFDVCTKIAREIFGIEPPHTVMYGFVGIRGGAVKISSSKGNAPTPKMLLNIYEPQVIRWLFEKYQPRDFFEFGFDDTIVRHYQEFQRAAGPSQNSHIDFGVLATVGPLADFDPELVRSILKLDKKVDLSRLDKVKYWLENYAPEKIYKLRDEFNTGFYKTLTNAEKQTVQKLHDYLNQGKRSESEIQNFLYSIINDPSLEKKQNLETQKRYFKIFYNMLFGRDDGPRLYLYLAAASRDKVLKLLNQAP